MRATVSQIKTRLVLHTCLHNRRWWTESMWGENQWSGRMQVAEPRGTDEDYVKSDTHGVSPGQGLLG